MSFNTDKTEIMLFKNVENSTNFFFYFDGKWIPLTCTSDHKHFGIQFSEEAKWNKHTGNVIKRVSKYICVLHKLKYKLNKHNLEKLYLIYIRPIFEYACEVWDKCAVSNSCKLERLQLEAARIITGLPIFTNTEYLYRETGWERLEERRTRRKLQLFYNIQNGSTPPYLLDLTPQQSLVRLFTPFEMATILLFHSVDFL
jgi:hypothetical protein